MGELNQKAFDSNFITEEQTTIEETNSMDLFQLMDEILKIKDQIISVKEDMINISNSTSSRLEKLETRVGIPR